MTATWGIHNNHLTTELVEEGFVSIGWFELGDLTQIPATRDGFKVAMAAVHPDATVHQLAAMAGVPYRFVHEIQTGDVVVAPYRPDGTINIGVVAGPYYFVAG